MESFSIQIQADEVQAAFIRLRDAAKDLSQAMRAITTALMSQTEANFAAQSGPSGPWPDLAESTRKRRGDAAMMLQDSGHLASSITPDSGPDFASIGTNVVYAAIHQLGGDIQRAPFSSWVRLREAKKNAASVRNFHAKSVAQTYLTYPYAAETDLQFHQSTPDRRTVHAQGPLNDTICEQATPYFAKYY